MLTLIQLLSDFRESCHIWYLVCRSPNYEGRQTLYARMLGAGPAELVLIGEKMDEIENKVRSEMGLKKL